MDKYNWKFPILDNGPVQGINDGGISTFKGSELYNNLAREICQNSLDAKVKDKKTVIVEFNSLSIKKDTYPSISGLKDIFSNCRSYWSKRMEPKLQRFLDEAENKLNKENIDFLVIRDFNTSGLSGAKAGRQDKSQWRALTHSNGVTEKMSGSGGSHGIGKNAPFACSSFRTIFYNSYAKKDGVKAFQGVTKLVTHIQDGVETQGVGFFLNTETNQPIFDSDKCPLRDLFVREGTEYGTDVVIAGFKKTATWKEDIEKAVISNFFVAIANEKLVVRIDDVEINSYNLKDRIKFYADIEALSKDNDKKITTILEFYYAITEPDFEESGSIMEDDDVVLYIKKDDKYSKSIAEMRSIGMVVRTRHHNIFTRYAAVLFVKEGSLNNLLKDIEPAAHDKWDPGIIEDDPEQETKARKYRSKLIAWVNNKITEKCRSEESDEMDLEGISAFLPYDEDDESLGENPETTNSPDGEPVFDEARKTKPNVRKVSLVAKKVKGIKDEEQDIHGGGGGGQGGDPFGDEDPNGEDDVIALVPGNKNVVAPKILQQRIVQMPSDSLYRAVFMLEEDCSKVNIAVRSIGDDRKKEKITIIECKQEKRKFKVNSEHVTLSNLKAKTSYEIFLTLEHSEKMTLELLIY